MQRTFSFFILFFALFFKGYGVGLAAANPCSNYVAKAQEKYNSSQISNSTTILSLLEIVLIAADNSEDDDEESSKSKNHSSNRYSLLKNSLLPVYPIISTVSNCNIQKNNCPFPSAKYIFYRSIRV